MNKYLIMYDLPSDLSDTKPADYPELYRKIKECGEWKRIMEKVWVIDSELTLEEASSTLIKANKGGTIMITEISNNTIYGTLPMEYWAAIQPKKEKI